MNTETVTISKDEYLRLKKKAEVADSISIQLEASLKDLEVGKVKRVR